MCDLTKGIKLTRTFYLNRLLHTKLSKAHTHGIQITGGQNMGHNHIIFIKAPGPRLQIISACSVSHEFSK